jgi:hypothetical protein
MTILILGDDLPRSGINWKCAAVKVYKYRLERSSNGDLLTP